MTWIFDLLIRYIKVLCNLFTKKYDKRKKVPCHFIYLTIIQKKSVYEGLTKLKRGPNSDNPWTSEFKVPTDKKLKPNGEFVIDEAQLVKSGIQIGTEWRPLAALRSHLWNLHLCRVDPLHFCNLRRHRRSGTVKFSSSVRCFLKNLFEKLSEMLASQRNIDH